ncbi:MAG: site-specific recombinase [Acidobacteriota bacterium]|jgi:site-specific DNA recombinase|nr:site-specific recombinase [Acidobacteriota bacterium]
MTKPYLPYARVSSDEQREAETIKTQMSEVNLHYSAHQYMPLAEWILDEGISGMIPFHERPGGARALELLRTGRYAGLACLNHKRIGRDAFVIHLAVRQIEQELGLDIQAVREPVPSQIAPGARALMRAMYAGVAQYDREELLAAMRAGKVRAAKEGRWSGGKVPFGLKLEAVRVTGRAKPSKRLAPDEETAPVVLEIFTLYAGGASQEKIASDFDARGIPHPTGDRWKQSTLSYILRNPAYKGEGAWRKRYEAKNDKGTKSKYNSPPESIIRYEDYQVPAIVPPDLWEQCARKRKEGLKFSPRNSRHLYLLSGLVRCGLCDRSMTGASWGQRYFYYRCTSRADARVQNCALRDVRAEELERVVWSGVALFAASPGKVVSKLRAAMGAKVYTGKVARDVEKELAAKVRERERVITWARQGRITEEELDGQLLQLRSEVVGLEAEASRIRSSHATAEEARTRLRDAESFLDELARRVHECTREEKQAILRRAVPRVTIKPHEGGRKLVSAVYRFAPPVIIANAPPRESP